MRAQREVSEKRVAKTKIRAAAAILSLAAEVGGRAAGINEEKVNLDEREENRDGDLDYFNKEEQLNL